MSDDLKSLNEMQEEVDVSRQDQEAHPEQNPNTSNIPDHQDQNKIHTQPRIQYGEDGKPLSKRGMKKMKKREKWLEVKKLKRAKEREKKKQRKREAVERGEELGPSRKMLKKNSMEKSDCKVQVVIDSSFDDFMNEKELNSHVLQIQHSYSANRRAPHPIQFYVTSLQGKSRTRLDQIGDYKGWDVNFHEEHYLEVFSKEKVVYLSSDSPNILQQVEDNKVYVIGGLVDHNNHKGLCYDVAVKAGIAHARLPIEEFIQMYTRKVLACNHVFEVLLRFTECGDWEQAFLQAIPSRKGAAEKVDDTHHVDSNDGHCRLDISECETGKAEGMQAEACGGDVKESDSEDGERSKSDEKEQCKTESQGGAVHKQCETSDDSGT